MNEIIDLIKVRLTEERYLHSIGVAKTAKKLALLNGVDEEKAYLAGLIHDYAKCLTSKELVDIAVKYDLISDSIEYKQPQLLHGPVGAILIEKDLKIKDQEILNAVRYHTTGCEDMSELTKVIYIADYIDPTRKFEGVEKLREVTFKNLNKGVLLGMDTSLRFVLDKGGLIHPLSILARNWLLMQT